MAINIDHEKLVSLSEACELLPKRNGKKTHRSTLWRWCSDGCNGVRLEHIRIGRNVYTTLNALTEFARAISEEFISPTAGRRQPTPKSDALASRRTQQARERLQNNGF